MTVVFTQKSLWMIIEAKNQKIKDCHNFILGNTKVVIYANRIKSEAMEGLDSVTIYNARGDYRYFDYIESNRRYIEKYYKFEVEMGYENPLRTLVDFCTIYF